MSSRLWVDWGSAMPPCCGTRSSWVWLMIACDYTILVIQYHRASAYAEALVGSCTLSLRPTWSYGVMVSVSCNWCSGIAVQVKYGIGQRLSKISYWVWEELLSTSHPDLTLLTLLVCFCTIYPIRRKTVHDVCSSGHNTHSLRKRDSPARDNNQDNQLQ